MGKHIIGENGISYTKGTDGIYYPDLKLPEGEDYEIGRYGNMRLEYLKNHRKGLYLDLLASGKLNGHLHECDEECSARMEFLTEQMKWAGLMNNVRSAVEEIVLNELVYC